jgi:hypothetical protein
LRRPHVTRAHVLTGVTPTPGPAPGPSDAERADRARDGGVLGDRRTGARRGSAQGSALGPGPTRSRPRGSRRGRAGVGIPGAEPGFGPAARLELYRRAVGRAAGRLRHRE